MMFIIYHNVYTLPVKGKFPCKVWVDDVSLTLEGGPGA